MGAKHGTIAERLWSKVDFNGPLLSPYMGKCWLWTAFLEEHGYPEMYADGRSRKAYRLAYELFHGPIDAKLQVDHLCRVPACVNPAHLEPVTHQENIRRGDSWSAKNARKVYCHHGHLLEGENVYMFRGQRRCQACKKVYMREYGKRREARRRSKQS